MKKAALFQNKQINKDRPQTSYVKVTPGKLSAQKASEMLLSWWSLCHGEKIPRQKAIEGVRTVYFTFHV